MKTMKTTNLRAEIKIYSELLNTLLDRAETLNQQNIDVTELLNLADEYCVNLDIALKSLSKELLTIQEEN